MERTVYYSRVIDVDGIFISEDIFDLYERNDLCIDDIEMINIPYSCRDKAYIVWATDEDSRYPDEIIRVFATNEEAEDFKQFCLSTNGNSTVKLFINEEDIYENIDDWKSRVGNGYYE